LELYFEANNLIPSPPFYFEANNLIPLPSVIPKCGIVSIGYLDRFDADKGGGKM